MSNPILQRQGQTIAFTRPRLVFADAFLAVASRIAIDPPITFIEELCDIANKNPTRRVFVTVSGSFAVSGFAIRDVYQLLVDDGGIVGGEWDPQLVAFVEKACTVYGIPGLT